MRQKFNEFKDDAHQTFDNWNPWGDRRQRIDTLLTKWTNKKISKPTAFIGFVINYALDIQNETTK